jgi:hypothetical protein
MTSLNFDWDDVSLDHPTVQQALSQLATQFPDQVWYRISSSGTGLHVLVAELSPELELIPVDFPAEKVMTIRAHFWTPAPEGFGLECGGRLRADRERLSHGFSIGRLFAVKNGNEVSRWLPYLKPEV